MYLTILNTSLDFDGTNLLNEGNYTLFINKNLLLSNYKTCDYDSYLTHGSDGRLAKQLLADILTDDISPLKIECRCWTDKLDGDDLFHVQIYASSMTKEGSIFRMLLERFRDVMVFIKFSCRYNFERMKIDQETYSCTAEDSLWMRHYRDKRYLIDITGMSESFEIEMVARIPDELFCFNKLSPDPKSDQSRSVHFPATVFKSVLEEGTFSDMTIATMDGAKVPCHKLVLYASSPVFQAMFQSGMEESKSGRLDMTDMSEAGVRALLRYLYYQDLETPKKDAQIAFEVLYAAQKYDMQKLWDLMFKNLLGRKDENFPVEVAFSMYIFSRGNLATFKLAMKAANVLKLKWDNLKKLSEYEEFCCKRPHDAQLLLKDLEKASLT